MRILIAGDIVGSPGRKTFAQVVARIQQNAPLDAVIANAENAAGGRGLTPKIADEIFAMGADVITMGDHTWDQKELLPHLEKEPRIVRPANFAPGCPGRGVTTIETPKGRISIINLVGRVFMPPADCPFRAADQIIREGGLAPVTIVDLHAEATSEKIAMGRYLDGRVSAVIGTHTHVQTSDDTLLPKGTAYLTDLGMTGARNSVLGRDLNSVLHKFLTGMPSKFTVSTEACCLEGVIVDVDARTGKALSIKRIREKAAG